MPKTPLIDRIDAHLTAAAPTVLQVETIASNLRASKERSSVGRALRTLFARGRVKRTKEGGYYVDRSSATHDAQGVRRVEDAPQVASAPEETSPAPVQEEETVSPPNGNAFAQ